mgnify:FL=1
MIESVKSTKFVLSNVTMIAGDLIQSEIPVLHLSDHVSTALNFFDDYKLSQIPVLGPKGFLGLIDEDIVLDAPVNFHLEDLKDNLSKERILDEQHLFDALSFFKSGKLSVLPVVDKDDQYLGCIHSKELLQKACEWLKVTEPGGVLHLEVSIVDYSLAQIAQIVEGNGSKILSSLCLPHPTDSKIMEVLIKINHDELSGVIQTFERYEYKIVASFHKNVHQKGLDDRFDSFIRYLNI